MYRVTFLNVDGETDWFDREKVEDIHSLIDLKDHEGCRWFVDKKTIDGWKDVTFSFEEWRTGSED